jgi:hypothetical protein
MPEADGTAGYVRKSWSRVLAALGFLNPLVAAAAMTLSSVFAVWNSLWLRSFRGRNAIPSALALADNDVSAFNAAGKVGARW